MTIQVVRCWKPFDLPKALDWNVLLDAADPDWTPPADGADVSGGWRDSSGNGLDATYAGTTNLYRSSVAILGNQPSVDFAGTDGLLVPAFNSPQPFTIVAVVTLDTNAAIRNICDSRSAANLSRLGVSAAEVVTMTANTSAATDKTLSEATAALLVAVYNGASSYVLLNGVQSATVDVGSSSPISGLSVGWAYNGAQRWLGDIHMVGVAPGVISNSRANDLHHYYSDLCGVP